MNKYQCDEKKCYYYNSEGIIFADGSHISKYGAKHLVNHLKLYLNKFIL